jgi:hypothetical protein
MLSGWYSQEETGKATDEMLEQENPRQKKYIYNM